MIYSLIHFTVALQIEFPHMSSDFLSQLAYKVFKFIDRF